MRLEQESAEEVRRRFYEFYDGVVCSIRIETWPSPRECEIVVNAKDSLSASGWSEVRLMVHGVSEFRFQLGKRAFEVLSSGLQFVWLDEKICVVLDAYPDDGPGLPALETNSAYVVGTTCDIEIAPIPVR